MPFREDESFVDRLARANAALGRAIHAQLPAWDVKRNEIAVFGPQRAHRNGGVSYVELMEAELILGDGSVQAGRGLMAALAKRMGEAREKHPWPEHADGKYQALGVVGEEYHELVIAVEKETPERMRDEALDVAVTALRMWAGEHERRGA